MHPPAAAITLMVLGMLLTTALAVDMQQSAGPSYAAVMAGSTYAKIPGGLASDPYKAKPAAGIKPPMRPMASAVLKPSKLGKSAAASTKAPPPPTNCCNKDLELTTASGSSWLTCAPC